MWLIWKLDLEYRKPNHLHITFVLLDIVLNTKTGFDAQFVTTGCCFTALCRVLLHTVPWYHQTFGHRNITVRSRASALCSRAVGRSRQIANKCIPAGVSSKTIIQHDCFSSKKAGWFTSRSDMAKHSRLTKALSSVNLEIISTSSPSQILSQNNFLFAGGVIVRTAHHFNYKGETLRLKILKSSKFLWK